MRDKFPSIATKYRRQPEAVSSASMMVQAKETNWNFPDQRQGKYNSVGDLPIRKYSMAGIMIERDATQFTRSRRGASPCKQSAFDDELDSLSRKSSMGKQRTIYDAKNRYMSRA
jgi:hypothetical protein